MEIKDGLEYLVGLGEDKTTHVEIGGLTYEVVGLQLLTPPIVKLGDAACLEFATLQGLVDFIGTLSADEAGKMLVHVESPWAVVLRGALDPQYRHREVFGRANHKTDCGFRFDTALDIQNFVIRVQTLFEEPSDANPGNQKLDLLSLVGNLSSEQAVSAVDDGVSQTVAVKAGVKMQEKVIVKNPWQLAPKRTFAEVKQPLAPFVLRIFFAENQPPKAALFECDNDAWKIDAIGDIGAWLKDKLEGKVPILA